MISEVIKDLSLMYAPTARHIIEMIQFRISCVEIWATHPEQRMELEKLKKYLDEQLEYVNSKIKRDTDMKYKGKWICSKDCELCEGKGMVVSGMEGFINRNMEPDCRDTYAPCENAIFDEPDYDNEREWRREREMEEA